jgi:hypothetical protein
MPLCALWRRICHRVRETLRRRRAVRGVSSVTAELWEAIAERERAVRRLELELQVRQVEPLTRTPPGPSR